MLKLAHVEPSLLVKAAATLGGAGCLLWAGWITHEVTKEDHPQIVTVRLAETIARFVDEAARAEADPEALQAASLAYLRAAEAAVVAMDGNGRIVLVAEAVLAGEAEDATPELERRISEELQKEAQS